MEAEIDHLVVDVRDRFEEGQRRYRALGFELTPIGRHSLGSSNTLAVFGRDYIELLGVEHPGGALRPDLEAFPIGLNGLVFRGRDAAALQARQQSRGVPVGGVVAFFRPVVLTDGTRGDAKFQTVRLDMAAAFDGRTYWCEHLTPELVWHAPWQAHPNGATGITRVVLAVRDPMRQAGLYTRMFGPAAVTSGADGRRILRTTDAMVEFVPHAAVAAEFGAAAPDPAGRADHMVGFTIAVRDLGTAAAALSRGGVEGVIDMPGGLRVPAVAAMNTTIDFVTLA